MLQKLKYKNILSLHGPWYYGTRDYFTASAISAVAGLPRPSTLRQGREQFPEFCFVSYSYIRYRVSYPCERPGSLTVVRKDHNVRL